MTTDAADASTGGAEPAPTGGTWRAVAPAAGGAEPEVLAVLATAVELAWPRPEPARPDDLADRARLAWRFSGRWWTGSAVAQRPRPAPVR